MSAKGLIDSLDKRLPTLREAAAASPADARLAATVSDLVLALRLGVRKGVEVDSLESAVVRLSGLRGDFLSSGDEREKRMANGVLDEILGEAGAALQRADRLASSDEDAPQP